MKRRSVALVLAGALCFGCAVGGTLAWLTDTTTTLTNTFTSSDVDIELVETTGNTYKMVPGSTISKDPTITVLADSEACWLYVKVEKSSNYDTYLEEYILADGWTALDGVSGVYYRSVNDTDTDQKFTVLANDQVKVKESVTKTQMDTLTSENYPTLKFTAYAIQQANITDTDNDGITVDEAWPLINN